MKTAFLIETVAVFLLYNYYTYLKFGILVSISESWYHLKQSERWMFTFMLVNVSLCLMIVGHTALFFLSGGFLGYVAMAPFFKRGILDERVHIIGAVGCFVFGFLGLLFDFDQWYLFVVFLAYIVATHKIKNSTYWLEFGGFIIGFVGLFIKTLAI